MRILVFGNINAGKSRIVSALSARYPDRPVIAIDEYRRHFGDGSIEGDARAIDAFVTDVVAEADCIAECTGLGPLGRKLQGVLAPKESVAIHVVSPLAACLERARTTDFSSVPYPPYPETIDATIRRCHDEFTRGDLETIWRPRVVWMFQVPGDDPGNPVARLPLQQLLRLVDVARFLRESALASELVWFGSGARGEMTEFSDVDLFAVTDGPAQSVMEAISSTVPDVVFADVIGDKVAVRFNDSLLVEISTGRSLAAIDHFYRHAGITDIDASILIGSDSTRDHLASLAPIEADIDGLVEYLLAEMVYFTLSLPPIAARGDTYKYYFHCNIILHNLIRLRAIERGYVRSNYLPGDGLSFLTEDERRSMPFRPAGNCREHYGHLVRSVTDCLGTLRWGGERTAERVAAVERSCIGCNSSGP